LGCVAAASPRMAHLLFLLSENYLAPGGGWLGSPDGSRARTPSSPLQHPDRNQTVTRLRNSHMANFQKADAFQMAGITFASGSRHFHERSDPETGRWRAKLFVTALSRFKGRYAPNRTVTDAHRTHERQGPPSLKRKERCPRRQGRAGKEHK
jgi:hypothetical protein